MWSPHEREGTYVLLCRKVAIKKKGWYNKIRKFCVQKCYRGRTVSLWTVWRLGSPGSETTMGRAWDKRLVM